MNGILVAVIIVLALALLLSDGFQGLVNWLTLLLDKLALWAMYAALGIVIVLILGALAWMALGVSGCGLVKGGWGP